MPIKSEIPITRVIRKKCSVLLNDSDYNKTVNVGITGEIWHIHMRVPNWTNDVKCTLSFEDEDGYEIWNSGAKDRNDNYNLLVFQTISEDCKMRVQLSGVPGETTGKTVVVVLWIYAE